MAEKISNNTISFADVAHQTLIFDKQDSADELVLRLIDTRWVQRLRSISQTGNTKLVYMFAEHSRFGHSLGVAYLASNLMKHLARIRPELVSDYRQAVAAAALLHDIGHLAPGSHLAERIWAPTSGGQHELVSVRIIREDKEISAILKSYSPNLAELVCKILLEDSAVPPWTRDIISGGGWNADRGNWAIVDSAMCAVTYGRYNVQALIDAYLLSESGEMVLHESRLDALTHFFVARDSMYRQVYQHRVLQAVDALTAKIICRLRDLLGDTASSDIAKNLLNSKNIFCDTEMAAILVSKNYASELPLSAIYCMTESWWTYHVEHWCSAGDDILRDLASRLRERRLLKTIRLRTEESSALVERAKIAASALGYDPRYFVSVVEDADAHRGKTEEAPAVLLDTGKIVPVTEVEPLIAQILGRAPEKRRWLVVPKEVKEKLGLAR